MSGQLPLFSPPPVDLRGATWSSGIVTDEMRNSYIHIVRAPDDPGRLSREECKALGIRDIAPHRSIDRTPVREWKRLIRSLLVERDASTGYADADRRRERRRDFSFNRMMVELAGVTADIAYRTNADAALWDLVEDGVLTHTLEAPIVFQLSDPHMLTDGVWDTMDGDGWRWCKSCEKLMPWNEHTGCQGDPCPCALDDDPERQREQLTRRARSTALRHANPRLRYVPGGAWNERWQLTREV